MAFEFHSQLKNILPINHIYVYLQFLLEYQNITYLNMKNGKPIHEITFIHLVNSGCHVAANP